MREEQSENKMKRIGEYKYHVVKFLENPFKETEGVSCGYVCVPKSWVTWCSPEDNIVRVWYPTQDPWNTENKVRKREKKSEQWDSFLSVLKYSTDIYEEAKMYILNTKYSEKNNEDYSPLSAKVDGRPCKTTSSDITNNVTVENILDAVGWSIFSKSTNTITLKRKAPTDSDKTTHEKRSRMKYPGESADEVAVPSSQAFKIHTISNKGFNVTPVAKSNNRNSTVKKQIVNQNTSEANHSSDPKPVVQSPIFTKCCKLIQELQKCLGVSTVTDIINKLMNTDNSESVLTDDTTASTTTDAAIQTSKLNEENRNVEQTEEKDSDEDDDCGDDDENDTDHSRSSLSNNTIAFASNDTTAQAAKLNEEKRNEKQTEENDSDDDYCDHNDCDDDNNIDESRTEQKRSRQPKTFVLPPEYDANDSRWTLKYREPAPGLFELLEDSGVYVNETSLKNGWELSRETDYMCKLLLNETFTASALRTCSWTGQKAPGSRKKKVRPGLDAHAREVLLDFAVNHTLEDDGSVVPKNELSYYRKRFKNTMYSYMLKMRAKTSK